MFFNETEIEDFINSNIKLYYEKGRTKVLNEFKSPGYAKIISSINISPDFEDINIIFQKGLTIDPRQDIIELFAQGGAIKKGDTFIQIPPSKIIQKYLGKR